MAVYLGPAEFPYTLRKYGARGVGLANLAFEPRASRGFAIQTDFAVLQLARPFSAKTRQS